MAEALACFLCAAVCFVAFGGCCWGIYRKAKAETERMK